MAVHASLLRKLYYLRTGCHHLHGHGTNLFSLLVNIILLYCTDIINIFFIDNKRCNISIGGRLFYFTQITLGEGQFAKVVKGELQGEDDIIPVAVKMLKGK